MLTMAPRRSISCGSSRCVIVASAVTLVSIICFHCARSACCAGAVPSARPALLTSRSMPANDGGRAAWAARMAASSRMSKAAACTRSAPWRSTSCRNRSARRPLAITRQPPATKRSTVAAPKPAVAPVIQAILPFMRLLAFFQGDRRDAGGGEFLLGRFQLGGRAERPQPYAVVGLPADIHRLHVGDEALQGQLGLLCLGGGGVGERAHLQQVAVAAAGRFHRLGRRGGDVLHGHAGCAGGRRRRCRRGGLLLLGLGLRADLGVGDAHFLLRQHRVEVVLRLLRRAFAGGRFQHARLAAALGGGLRVGLRSGRRAQVGEQAAAHHDRHQDRAGEDADYRATPARKSVAAAAYGLPAPALACSHYIISGALRPSKSSPFFSTWRVATTSASRALRRLASSTRNWCEL